MGLDLTNLLSELDEGLIYLGSNDVRVDKNEQNACVTIPAMAEDLELIVPELDAHLGYSPAKYEFEKEQTTGEEAETGADPELPYLVLSKFAGLFEDPQIDLKYHKYQKLKESRVVRLGVYFVPETSTKEHPAAAPKPHQCRIGETITFWVRPRTWRERGIIYLVREPFADPLFQVLEKSPDELLEAVERGEMAIQEDEEMMSDGGRDPKGTGSQASAEDDPPVIEDVLDGALDDDIAERWRRRGYAIDVAHNRGIDLDLVRDLLGTSAETTRIRSMLTTGHRIGPHRCSDEEVLRTTLQLLLDRDTISVHDLEQELISQVTDDSDLPAIVDLSDLVDGVVRVLEDYDVVPTMVRGGQNAETVLQLAVQPTAVHAALTMAAEETGSERGQSRVGKTTEGDDSEQAILFAQEDEGKPVMTHRGEEIGTVVRVEVPTAYIEPAPALADRIKSSLGWSDAEEDQFPLRPDWVERITESSVELKKL